MKDFVHESNGRRLVRILVRNLHMDFPDATSEGRYPHPCIYIHSVMLTVFWAFETHKEFLHIVVDQRHFIVAHEATQQQYKCL
jgi:hypothetical protein